MCAPIEQLEPLPDAGICDAHELDALRSDLSSVVEPGAGSLLIRVEFDETSKARNVCAAGPSAAAETRARRALAGQLSDIMDHPHGPSCLAGRRLDLNRQLSKLAEIRNVERTCSETARNSGEMQLSMDLRINAIRQSRTASDLDEQIACVEQDGFELVR